MHIAVCDDNVADRKQLERLLKRESDRRMSSGDVFYTDSYGNVNAVMQSPMLYDVFFLDMTQGEINGLDLARRLSEAGVTAPLVLCCSCIDYRSLAETATAFSAEQLYYLDKPIRTAELSSMLEHVSGLRQQLPPAIELRGQYKTLYVPASDIRYAKEDGLYLDVGLRTGGNIKIRDSLYNFYSNVENNPDFYPVSDHALININDIDKLSLRSLTLTDGTILTVSPRNRRELQKYLRVRQ